MKSAALTLVVLLPALSSAAGLRVILDAGHGGTQAGAISETGRREKDVALQITQRVRAVLTERGARVLMTRTTDADVPLISRVAFASGKNAALFVSIHANSMPSAELRQRTEGVETFFLAAEVSGADAARTAARENQEAPSSKKPQGTLSFILADLVRTEAHADSARLAYSLHESLLRQTGAVDRGVQQAPLFVLTGVEIPAALVEVGFISHPAEEKRLASSEYQSRIAQGIADGIEQFATELRRRDGELSAVDDARPVASPK